VSRKLNLVRERLFISAGYGLGKERNDFSSQEENHEENHKKKAASTFVEAAFEV
jgi:hypothetical protein